MLQCIEILMDRFALSFYQSWIWVQLRGLKVLELDPGINVT